MFEVQSRSSEFARPTGESKPLTEADAVEIWIARWLRIQRKDLIARFGCDPARLYEIWWGQKFPRSKEKAAAVFRQRYPGLVERTAFGYRRIPRAPERSNTEEQTAFRFD